MFQSLFQGSGESSARRGKSIDSRLRKVCLRLSMLFLVADVVCFVLGVTAASRKRAEEMTPEERFGVEELQRIQSSSEKGPVIK